MIDWDSPLHWLLPILAGFVFSLFLALRLAYSSSLNLQLRLDAIRETLRQPFDASIYLHHGFALLLNIGTIWLLMMGFCGICLELTEQPVELLLTPKGQAVVTASILILQIIVYFFERWRSTP